MISLSSGAVWISPWLYMHNNSVMWSEKNLPGKQFFDILRFIFWLMRFYVFILARSIASSFGQNLLCKAQKARIDFKADKFGMQPCSLKAFKDSIFGRNSFNFLKRRQFVTRTLSGVSSLLTYFLMPLFLVDNGRNDCVDSMVNDVESLISIHRKGEHTTSSDVARDEMSLSTCDAVTVFSWN